MSCKLSPLMTICMTLNPVFWENKKKNVSKCRLLNFLSSKQSMKMVLYIGLYWMESILKNSLQDKEISAALNK